MAPFVCTLVEGDVVNLPFPGRDGKVKSRYGVVMARRPPHKPAVLIIIFCCSDTSPAAAPGTYYRVEADTLPFNRMGLGNASTFHDSDIRAYDAASPLLTKKGFCPTAAFLELKKVVTAWLATSQKIEVLPAGKASDAAHAAANPPPPEPPKTS